MKLTKTAVDAMVFEGTHPKSKDLRWDDEVPGFAVRVWPSNKKTFVFFYRQAGRQHLMTLGPYGVMTLQQARDRARELKVETLKGKDPLEEKRRRNQAGHTFGDLATDYRKRHMGKKRSARDDESMLTNDLDVWRNKPLTSIKRADVAQLHHKISERAPIRANRVVSLLSKMFNLAKTWGFLPEHWSNPASGIDRNEELERQRFVTPDEMPALVAAIDAQPNPFIRGVIWMYLLTGKRKSELLKLKWKDVDFTRHEIRIGKTKSGKPDIVPLIPRMAELLKSLPRMTKNPYVFCGSRQGRHLVELKRNWQTIRETAKIEDIRIHDLRHTVASWLVSSGASLALVGRVLNHSNPRMTQRYAHFLTAPVATALEGHEKALQIALKQGDSHQEAPAPEPVDPGASSPS